MSTTKDSKRIDSVTVNRIQDEDADLSYLGEYSDKPDNDFAIVNIGEHRGEFVSDLPCTCGATKAEHDANIDLVHETGCEEYDAEWPEKGREYRFFNPANVDSSIPVDEQRTYAMQDFKRMSDYGNYWNNVGVRATASIVVNNTIQTIKSGGLWGIESDSEDSYFKEVEDEELSELKDQLHAIGFSKRAIAAAFRNVLRDSE